MPLRFKDSQSAAISRILLIVFLVVSIVLMTVYAMEGSHGPLHTVQSQVNALVAPVKMIGASGGAAVEKAAQDFGDATADADTLSELRSQNKELTELLTQAEEYRLEAKRLQGLLNLKDAYDIDGVAGRVIGQSTDAWNQTITIDVGSADGVEPGLTVIGPSGVIGQVISVGAGSSTVRLLTDPQSGVAVMIQSSRAEGIVRGSLSGLLFLENIDVEVEVNLGDVVLTSGLGGSYTKGLLVGTVVRVEGRTGDDSRKIVVSQNEQVRSLEEVIVVFSASEASQSALADIVASTTSSDSDGAPQDDSGASGSGDANSGGSADGGDATGTPSQGEDATTSPAEGNTEGNDVPQGEDNSSE